MIAYSINLTINFIMRGNFCGLLVTVCAAGNMIGKITYSSVLKLYVHIAIVQGK